MLEIAKGTMFHLYRIDINKFKIMRSDTISIRPFFACNNLTTLLNNQKNYLSFDISNYSDKINVRKNETKTKSQISVVYF